MKPQLLKVLISGGGTGGHIFPALAIADALKKRMPEAEILFVGAKGRMEMERIPAAGYAIKGLWISGFQRKFSFANLLFPLKLVLSLAKARTIIKTFKPQVVVGVGGYASGPTLRVATQMGIPTLIQEQNSYPGVTNRLLSKKVHKICVAYPQMDRWFPTEKTVLTGNPVREASVAITGKYAQAMTFFELRNDMQTILVIGGSQGALAINKAIHENLAAFTQRDVQLIWQTGKQYFQLAADAVSSLQLSHKIKVTAFIERMDMAYAAADLIISRAGAMAISEISLVAKPAVLVPLPSAAEDHQTSNARRLSDAGAAVLIHNNEASVKLIPTAFELMEQAEKLTEMSKNIAAFAQKDAADHIADEIIQLAKQ